jgi:hypothetical protein
MILILPVNFAQLPGKNSPLNSWLNRVLKVKLTQFFVSLKEIIKNSRDDFIPYS